MKKTLITISTAFTLVFASAGFSLSAAPDWDAVDSKKVTLFYPGVASWEFLNSPDHSLGAKNIKEGKKACVKCHTSETGEYDIMADDIASGKFRMKKSGKPFEPEPIAGKKGFMEAKVQSAHDNENIYLRIEWQSKGGSFKDPALAKKGLQDRVMVQMNKDHDYFRRYGCFIACHDDANHMPGSPTKDEVKKHPYYSALKRDTVRLYAFYTRTGGWNDLKPKAELEELSKTGLIDVWEVEIEGKDVKTEDGWILEDRRDDEKADIAAEGSWADGKYSVVIKRKLKTEDKKDVSLEEGAIVSIAIAIHDDGTDNRRHYVSFPLQLGIGTGGDITAKKVR
ncbi:MAG: ethylbenzene dehydrogenase-related protein [Thermodesulfobacteriota bacterium]